MKPRSIISAFAITALILAGVTVVSVAANGDPTLLGKGNTATKTTTIKTTGNGAALSLKSRSNRAPLKVSNNNKIKRLNADLVDGLDGASLQTRPTVFTPPGLTPAVNTVKYNLPIQPGEYLIEWAMLLITAASPTSVDCYIRREAVAAADDLYIAGQTLQTAGTLIGVGGAGYLRTVPGATYHLTCNASNPFTTNPAQPTQIILTRLDGSTQSVVNPAPKPGPVGRP